MASRVIAAAEPAVVIAVTPLLLFPMVRPAWTAAGLVVLISVWVARGLVHREPWPVTPFNPALLLFCLAIPLAVWASATADLTIPKLTGLILGLAAFRVVAFSARPTRGLALAAAVFAALGLVMWVVGLLGIRLAVLAPLVQRLPARLASLPGAPDAGINPNELAGVLVLYLPFCVAIILLALRQRRIAPALVLVLLALGAGATLILTRSRAGWIGLAAAVLGLTLMLLALEGNRRLKRIAFAAAAFCAVAALVAAAVLLAGQPGAAAATDSGQLAGGMLQQMTLDSRIEIWSRALYAIQDFPFTGVGLGTFRRVVNLLYPLFLVPPDVDIGHAHNIFLQAGVDLGLGGLIGYVALLLVSAVAAWEVARDTQGAPRYLALGLLSALIGLHVYGLADALALGSKPGLAFWVVLGLIAALGNGYAGRAGSLRSGIPVIAQRTQAVPLSEGQFGGVEQPVGDDGNPDAAAQQEQSRQH